MWVDQMASDQLTPAIRATDTVSLDGQSWGYGGDHTACGG
jgi:hypothetical protein